MLHFMSVWTHVVWKKARERVRESPMHNENLRNYRKPFKTIDYPIWLIRQNKCNFIVYRINCQQCIEYSKENPFFHPSIYVIYSMRSVLHKMLELHTSSSTKTTAATPTKSGWRAERESGACGGNKIGIKLKYK